MLLQGRNFNKYNAFKNYLEVQKVGENDDDD